MENRISFGKWETIALLINGMTARMFLNYPRPTVENSGTAAWIQILYISIIALLFFTIITKLYKKFEGKDLIDICEMIGGGALRAIIGVIIVALLFCIGALILREYSENMKTIALEVSPISYVMLFFTAGMIVGAFLGLETIVRLHAIAVPAIVGSLLFILIAVSPFYDFSNLFPLFGKGMGNVFGKGFFSLSLLASMLYLFFMPPFIKTHKNFKIIGYISLGTSIFFLMSSVVVYELVMHYPTGEESFLPTFQLARMINYGRFFQRVESVFMFAWVASGLLFLSVILFFASYLFKKAFGLKYYKPLVFPFAILIFCLSLLPPNLMTAILMETRYYQYFAWAVVFLLPVILLLVGRVLKRRRKKEKTQDA